jgi:hypothetical protein
MNERGAVLSAAACIIGYFRGGLTPGNDVMRYACSSLGLCSAPEVCGALCRDDGGETGLRDLLLFPSHGLRLSLEERLPLGGIPPEDVEGLYRLLRKRINRVTVRFSGADCRGTMTLPGPALRGFLSRLNVGRDLSGIFHPGDTGSLVLEARVAVRNSRFVSSGGRDRFLRAFLHAFLSDGGPGEPLFTDCLAFVLRLFEESDEDSGVFEALSRRKKLLLKSLLEAAEFKEVFGRYSMDFIMMQRIGVPLVNAEEALRMISLADFASRAVYGRPAEGLFPLADLAMRVDIPGIRNRSRLSTAMPHAPRAGER